MKSEASTIFFILYIFLKRAKIKKLFCFEIIGDFNFFFFLLIDSYFRNIKFIFLFQQRKKNDKEISLIYKTFMNES
jgi:hypothetical protein